jgi:hypothetical protein
MGEFLQEGAESAEDLGISSRKDETRDTIGETALVEIDEKPEGHVEQLHVTEKLCLVDGENPFN